MSHTLVFDIGKTNKKCFVFDEDYNEVWKEYARFDEIVDEDGYPCDDILAIADWVKKTFQKVLDLDGFQILAVNFSTYGASFVHIDNQGDIIAPLYNYLKPFPKDVLKQFFTDYGSEISLAKETASPSLEMLNSGLQLYFLKYAKPKLFSKIHRSLHLPQFLSYLFTNVAVSDFTSIGCHTMLWDFEKQDYHTWVYTERIDKILPPIARKKATIKIKPKSKEINFGIGIHDSSAALLPYLRANKNPFLLISTGTWSIALNAFTREGLSEEDLRNDALNFLQTDGGTVRAARLFLGNEYKNQVEFLRTYYNKEEGYHRQVKFDVDIHSRLIANSDYLIRFESLNDKRTEPVKTELSNLVTYEEAYHQLMIELVDLQIKAAERAIGNSNIEKIFIDGGFADNDIFIRLITRHFKDCKIRASKTPLGSALGAAINVSDKKLKKKFLKKHYAKKKSMEWK